MAHPDLHLGDVEILTLCEGFAPLPLGDECPGQDVDWPAERRAHPWAFLDDANWAWHVHSFLLRTPAGDVLVDTGVGAFGPWEPWGATSRPEPSGMDPAAVRHVILTHLHADHAGGVVLPDGSPRFRNARYHVHPADWEFFAPDPGGAPDRARRYDAHDEMRTLNDAGLVSLDPDDTDVSPGVRVIHTPGHTPGHRSVLVSAGGDTLLLTGDALHTPVQVAHPHWPSSHDEDPQEASRSRVDLMARAKEERWNVGVSHFADPFGTVGPNGWIRPAESDA